MYVKKRQVHALSPFSTMSNTYCLLTTIKFSNKFNIIRDAVHCKLTTITLPSNHTSVCRCFRNFTVYDTYRLHIYQCMQTSLALDVLLSKHTNTQYYTTRQLKMFEVGLSSWGETISFPKSQNFVSRDHNNRFITL